MKSRQLLVQISNNYTVNTSITANLANTANTVNAAITANTASTTNSADRDITDNTAITANKINAAHTANTAMRVNTAKISNTANTAKRVITAPKITIHPIYIILMDQIGRPYDSLDCLLYNQRQSCTKTAVNLWQVFIYMARS